jgi:hypothetical protein
VTIFTPQKPNVSTPLTPTFTACTTSDKFQSNGGGTYILWYRNGATPTTQLYIVDQNTTVPAGAATPAVPTGATNWSDALITSALAASSDRVIAIDDINMAQYTDSTLFVNLKHNTPTTLTLAVLGPF